MDISLRIVYLNAQKSKVLNQTYILGVKKTFKSKFKTLA